MNVEPALRQSRFLKVHEYFDFTHACATCELSYSLLPFLLVGVSW